MPTWRKTIKARKEHKCIICRKPILAGTKYIKDTEQEGNGFVNLKMHPNCESVFDDYMYDLHNKVENAEESSLVEPPEFADPDDFYEDEDGSIQYFNGLF